MHDLSSLQKEFESRDSFEERDVYEKQEMSFVERSVRDEEHERIMLSPSLTIKCIDQWSVVVICVVPSSHCFLF